MSNVDPFSEIAIRPAANVGLAGVCLPAAGNANWIVIDRAGFESLVFAIGFSTPFTGTANLFMDESEDNSNWSAVAVDQIRGRAAAAAATAGLVGPLADIANKTIVIGTTSKARYIRLRQANSSGASATGWAIALLANGNRRPVALTAW